MAPGWGCRCHARMPSFFLPRPRCSLRFTLVCFLAVGVQPGPWFGVRPASGEGCSVCDIGSCLFECFDSSPSWFHYITAGIVVEVLLV